MLKDLRESPAAAHVVPLVVFTAMLSITGWFKIENSELPWHVKAPELWVYPLQTIVCAAVLPGEDPQEALAPDRDLARLRPGALVGRAVRRLVAELGVDGRELSEADEHGWPRLAADDDQLPIRRGVDSATRVREGSPTPLLGWLPARANPPAGEVARVVRGEHAQPIAPAHQRMETAR